MPGVKGWPSHGLTEAPGERGSGASFPLNGTSNPTGEPTNTLRGSLLVPMVSHGFALWSEWTDPASGEVIPNFTMITQNCDQAPVFNLMHRRDPKRQTTCKTSVWSFRLKNVNGTPGSTGH